ncbi:hypothetical protein O974_00650 [Mycobacterium avium 11-0986]|nr:hypothetical protein O974_00650 [Mycobacterium avium 11-0986]
MQGHDRAPGIFAARTAVAARKYAGLSVPSNMRTGVVMFACRSVKR